MVYNLTLETSDMYVECVITSSDTVFEPLFSLQDDSGRF